VLQSDPPEVFTASEIARAADVSETEVLALIEAGAIRTIAAAGRQPFVAHLEAVRVGRALAAGLPLATGLVTPERDALFDARPGNVPTARAPFAISTFVHGGLIAAAVIVATLGVGGAQTVPDNHREPEPLRMVYLALHGPGGGGGGGGIKAPTPAPKAERKGRASLSSPLPVRTPPPTPERVETPPPKVEPELLPPVEAPVVAVSAEKRDRIGVFEDTPPRADSRGSGTQGGVGTGQGTGLGEGEGSGIGEGSGGGTGGGPYRPGSGIDPPSLLREVKPTYTEEARTRGIRGEVVMEIVVRRDGSVGDVRVLQGLGYGLDARALEAVRQWRFAPARRRGTPVDVIVEVAMEFEIR